MHWRHRAVKTIVLYALVRLALFWQLLLHVILLKNLTPKRVAPFDPQAAAWRQICIRSISITVAQWHQYAVEVMTSLPASTQCTALWMWIAYTFALLCNPVLWLWRIHACAITSMLISTEEIRLSKLVCHVRLLQRIFKVSLTSLHSHVKSQNNCPVHNWAMLQVARMLVMNAIACNAFL